MKRKQRPGRKSDWEQRYNDYLASVVDKPHEYGSHDCLLHVANGIKAITGKDYGRGHRGKYNSALGAAKHLKKHKADSPEQYLDNLFPEKPIGFAQRGDVVLVEVEGQRLPGLVDLEGDEAAVVGENVQGHEGLFRVPRAYWVKAWAVE